MKYGSIYLVSIIFFLMGCYKPLNEPKNLELPEITTTGKNTFGVKVDNKVWFNYGNSKGAYNSVVKNKVFALFYEYQQEINSSLTISGQMTYKNHDQRFLFTIIDKDIQNLGVFTAKKAEFIDIERGTSNTEIDTQKPLKVTILKLDKINKIVSGTFEGVLLNKNLKDKLTLENGRFDVVYK